MELFITGRSVHTPNPEIGLDAPSSRIFADDLGMKGQRTYLPREESQRSGLISRFSQPASISCQRILKFIDQVVTLF
jgi:hypothetical protein